jgi:hypothetical protein
MNFEDSLYFSNVRKNDQNTFDIFGKDFSVKKLKKLKLKKTIFEFFFPCGAIAKQNRHTKIIYDT